MQSKTSRLEARLKRKLRVRAKITGTKDRPRLSVFRSNTAIYAQLIDDAKGETLVSSMKKGKTKKVGHELGSEIAKLALKKHIKTVVFDRSGFRFHGAVKEVAEGAREGGMTL